MEFILKNKKKAILIGIAIITLIITSILYYNVQVNSLTKLGYTKSEAKKIVNPISIFNVVTREKNRMNDEISKLEKSLLSMGLSQNELEAFEYPDNKMLSKLNYTKEKKNSHQKNLEDKLSILEKYAKQFNVKYEYPKGNVYIKHQHLSALLDKELIKQISKYQKMLLQQGLNKAQIKRLEDEKSKINTLLNLSKKYQKEKENEKKITKLFSSKKLQQSAMRMFNETNEYRRSLGLKPYKYNYAKQSCVLKEAQAYARNKNPHNWLCNVANENAALASDKSDYVAIAMKFFKNDPPHERVLSGNYKSVAIAIVNHNGMNYMIMGVFN